jgi:hypothetical protein
MTAEYAIDGVFVSSVLVSGVLALAIMAIVRRILAWLGAYRFVWHPALFDTALFVIVWAVVALPFPPVR